MKSYVTVAVDLPVVGDVDWTRADQIAAMIQDHLRSTGFPEIRARASVFYQSEGHIGVKEIRVDDEINRTAER